MPRQARKESGTGIFHVMLNTWLQKNGIILARMELNAYFCKRKVKIGETNYGIRQGTIHSGAHSRVRGSS